MTASVHATEILLFSGLLRLIAMIGAARLFNTLARAVGQPGVTGEIVAGPLLQYLRPRTSHAVLAGGVRGVRSSDA